MMPVAHSLAPKKKTYDENMLVWPDASPIRLRQMMMHVTLYLHKLSGVTFSNLKNKTLLKYKIQKVLEKKRP